MKVIAPNDKPTSPTLPFSTVLLNFFLADYGSVSVLSSTWFLPATEAPILLTTFILKPLNHLNHIKQELARWSLLHFSL